MSFAEQLRTTVKEAEEAAKLRAEQKQKEHQTEIAISRGAGERAAPWALTQIQALCKQHAGYKHRTATWYTHNYSHETGRAYLDGLQNNLLPLLQAEGLKVESDVSSYFAPIYSGGIDYCECGSEFRSHTLKVTVRW